MEVGVVRVAEDKDYSNLKNLIDNHTGWKLDYNKSLIKVWTKTLPETSFKMVKVIAVFPDISGEVLYDVLHDPEYRKVWDQHMIESHDIGFLNPNNDVGYYSMSCPSPLANRDFVLQRSWLDLGNEKYILNHSVFHSDYPVRKGFIRATSYLTGFLIKSDKEDGCTLGYISQTDPQGTLPPWLVNKVTQIFGPKMVKNLQKATLGYIEWKKRNCPYLKPWIYPEQIKSPRLKLSDCSINCGGLAEVKSTSSASENLTYAKENYNLSKTVTRESAVESNKKESVTLVGSNKKESVTSKESNKKESTTAKESNKKESAMAKELNKKDSASDLKKNGKPESKKESCSYAAKLKHSIRKKCSSPK